MTVTLSITELLTICALASVAVGVVTWLFRFWRSFGKMKADAAGIHADIAVIIKCLRVLLEAQLNRYENAKEPLGMALDELNLHLQNKS